MFTIYKITNLLDGKKYIGFTTKNPPEARWKRHQVVAKENKRNWHLHCAIRKFGASNFSFEAIEVGENNDYGLKIAEPMYIAWLKPEYNMTKGGEGVPGVVISESHRKALSIAMKGKNTRPKSEEHKRKLSLSQVGKTRPGRPRKVK